MQTERETLNEVIGNGKTSQMIMDVLRATLAGGLVRLSPAEETMLAYFEANVEAYHGDFAHDLHFMRSNPNTAVYWRVGDCGSSIGQDLKLVRLYNEGDPVFSVRTDAEGRALYWLRQNL